MSDWFERAKYGMFIHWGAYSVAERGEWILNRERIGYEEYTTRYADNFKAENFNPYKWAELAKKAGMKYMVLTTKHHDGFCLWDTKTTDFSVMNHGAGRDLVKEFADAVRESGLKVGFYYSPADWHNKDYPGAYWRDWANEWEDEEARRRFVAFYTQQIKELMTNYGRIDLLWYDGCDPKPLDGERVNKMIKELQPHIVINNRNGEPCDFYCSEQTICPPSNGKMWEACMTLNDNWGYHSGDDNYKSPVDVIKMLAKVSENGRGNLLLNVGPKADGEIPKESADILETVGKWLSVNGDAIYNAESNTFSWGMSHSLTVSGNRVNVILTKRVKELCFAEIKNKIKRVYLLSTGEDIPFVCTDDGRIIITELEAVYSSGIAPVVVFETEGTPVPLIEKTTFWIPQQI